MTSARVLIVEDESVVALDLQNNLQDLGFTVVGQTDRGETALLKAEQLRPDLVLMDIHLKGEMDGIQAAEQIHTRFLIPIIFLTALADESTIQRAQLAEAYGYILKPFNIHEMNSNILIALYKYQMEQKLRQSEAKYRLLFETMAQGVVYQDAQGKIFSANPAAERILGLTFDQMQGRTSIDPRWRAIHQDGSTFPGEAHPAMKALRSGQDVTNVVMGVYNPQLEDTVWININAHPQFLAGETAPCQVFTTFEDITARKQAEADEREQRQFAEALRNSAEALSSTLSFEGVLEQILDSIGQVVPYDAVAIPLLKDGKLHIARHRGWVERGLEEFVNRDDIQLEDLPGLMDMYTTQKIFLAADIPEQANLAAFPATHWVRSFAGVPICIRQQVIGFLNLSSATPNFYNGTLIKRLKAFASQVAVAIENARLFEQTHHDAITDGLTGLYNSRHFYDLAIFEFERVRRYQSDLSVIMLDVDHFKSINDAYGHPIGDEVLRETAQLVQNGFRKVDIVTRYGGDEFVVLMPDTGIQAACLAAERVRKTIAETPVLVDGRFVSITVSVGVATDNPSCPDFNSLIKAADDALYAAKAAGRNRVACPDDPVKL